MPPRLHRFAPAPPQTVHVAAETEDSIHRVNSTPPQLAPAASGGMHRRTSSLPCSVGFQTQPSRPHLAALAIAVDRWGEAHGGPHVAVACREIKELLRKNFFSNTETDGPPLEFNFHNSRLRSLPPELGQATRLQTLNLRSNLLMSLPVEIGQIKALRLLNASENGLVSFPAEMAHVKTLQSLLVSYNRLTSFPAEMGQATALEMLDLGANRLVGFPAEMGKALALKTLNLRDNRLTSFPHEMGQAPALKSLYLGHNLLTQFPAGMGNATALQMLALDANQLTSFPGEMGRVKTLRVLNLSDNQLTSFPPEMAQATALHTLYLGENQLTDFPAEMGQAKALRILHLNANQLTSFPAEMGQATALCLLNLTSNQLTHFPGEISQAKVLQTLYLGENQLTSFPAAMGQAKTLQTLNLESNQLTSFPGEMGQATALQMLTLHANRLTSFPAEMGQAKALKMLDLSNNELTSFPAEMGQATALETLDLRDNQLNDLPAEVARLPNLRYMDLANNNFTHVPRALLEAPAIAEINLQYNPLPEAEIRAVHEAIAQRRAAGLRVPQLLLPALAGNAGELREAAANNMNVHTGVLTQAFKKRLDELTNQFPDHLIGGQEHQTAQLKAIEERLMQAVNTYVAQHEADKTLVAQARGVIGLMFQKGQDPTKAYINDFQHSAGHVLAYTFLALEAQWARTPKAHQAEARHHGMAGLIRALQSGSGMCDTRLCEEVMQTVGLPLTEYAQAHPEVVAIEPAQITTEESRDIVLATAKQVLQELLDADPTLRSDVPPVNWRLVLEARMKKDHPRLPTEEADKQMQHIELAWETFSEMVTQHPDKPAG